MALALYSTGGVAGERAPRYRWKREILLHVEACVLLFRGRWREEEALLCWAQYPSDLQ